MQVRQALAAALLLDDATRLYRLEGEGPAMPALLVQAWRMHEALDAPWRLELFAIGTDAQLDLDQLLGQRLTLWTRLADGGEHPRSGLVTAASAEASDGGFARYRLLIEPGFALLRHRLHSRVWQERTVVEIVDALLATCPHADWHWSPCVAAHLAASAGAGRRPYVVQYRENDLAFVQRLLAREGLAMRFEASSRLTVLADSASGDSSPQDASDRRSPSGLRFHAAGAQQAQDAIQAFGGERHLPAAESVVLDWDPLARRAVAASATTRATWGGDAAPRLEDYEVVTDAGARAAELRQQAQEARHKRWFGRSTVRTFGAGHAFRLGGGGLALPGGDDRQRFLLTAVTHAGINNLPQALSAALARELGEPDFDSEALLPVEVLAQAAASGYANRFEAIRAAVPWRPLPMPGLNAGGLLTATVVGPDGQTDGPDEIHTDRLGRIRIRFDFQTQADGAADTGTASPWVRVLQRWAGAGLGTHFTPRLGQEVLVDFIDGDLERPLVLGALYNGRGETETPSRAGDHRPSAQGNLVDAGHSPAWHGATGPAALSGIKSHEFGGGGGFNQLVFDDSDGELRTQLATTQHATQLNLGHLVHQADQHRGSARGLGWELRSDAYGAVRAGQGVLISSFGTEPQEPAGDNAPGIALHGLFKTLAQRFDGMAGTHRTPRLGTPLDALHTILKGMGSSKDFFRAQDDAANRSTATGAGRLPQAGAPIIEIAAKAGLATAAGQDVLWSAGADIVIGAGQDMHIASGGAARIHSGAAIGLLAGAIGPGDQAAGSGLTVIAGKGDIEMQAQGDAMQIAARSDLAIQSQSAHVDWASARRIVLNTAGGASVTLEGGNITVECPGKILVRAGKKSFEGADAREAPSISLPRSSLRFDEKFQLIDSEGQPIPNMRVEITRSDGVITPAVTDAQGMLPVQQGFDPARLRIRVVGRVSEGAHP